MKNVLIKCLKRIVGALVHLIEKLGGQVEELLVQKTDDVVKELEELENMTIAELRVYAKELEISLQGKRIKNEIIEIIKEHINKEWCDHMAKLYNVNLIDTCMKKFDDTSDFEIQLVNADNSAYVIPNGATLELIVEGNNGNILHFDVTVTNANNGMILFNVGNLAVGNYNCEVILTYTDRDEEIRTFPTNGYFALQVFRNLLKS